MNNDELYHHGIKGQKWGIRRFQNKDGSLTTDGKKRYSEPNRFESLFKGKKQKKDTAKKKISSNSTEKKKNIHDMSDDELRKAISRMQLEQQYSNLSAPAQVKKVSRGKKIAMDILEASARNIGTQTLNYALGKGINSIVGDEVIKVGKSNKDDKKNG